jgi:homoserine dehydrogenase
MFQHDSSVCEGNSTALALADSLLGPASPAPSLDKRLIGAGVGVRDSVVVLKFGSSVLRTRGDLPSAVHEIYRWYRDGHRVIAVVSAIGDTTDLLLASARDLASEPEPYALAELLATGERAAAALLGVALDRVGVRARVVDPRTIGLLALGTVLDSEPVGVNREQLQTLLAQYPVLVVPGFFGYDEKKRLHLLGRGGSDLTATFLASAVSATRCRLIKDVDGVYQSDPAASVGYQPRRFSSLGYEQALALAGPLIQPKAVHFLQRQQRTAEVAALGATYESHVGFSTTTLAETVTNPPTRVLLLGVGTVGGGVYRRLSALPAHFRVVGAFVRSVARASLEGASKLLFKTDEAALQDLDCDIVVDALPGLEPSTRLVTSFLSRGIHVVSANKALIAQSGPILSLLASRHEASLRYSATVGGSAPMIETVRRLAANGEIASLTAILSGTCNYVLERCDAGVRLLEALREAQTLGYAEADASEDLSGRDTARKLRILARHAFGCEVDALSVEGIEDDALERHLSEVSDGQTLRLIGSAAKLSSGRLEAHVRLEWISADHVLVPIAAEWNALAIAQASGEITVVTGRGAGRWPTTEAVISDLLDLRRERVDVVHGRWKAGAASQDV